MIDFSHDILKVAYTDANKDSVAEDSFDSIMGFWIVDERDFDRGIGGSITGFFAP